MNLVNAGNWSKQFGTISRIVLINVSQNSWLEESAWQINRGIAINHFSTVSNSFVNLLLQLVLRLLAGHRANINCGITRIANFKILKAFLQTGHKIIVIFI